MSLRTYLIAVAAVGSIVGAVGGFAPGGTAEAASTTQATVTDIIDGDTIRVRFDGVSEKVRLIGIDTPEYGGASVCEAEAATTDLQRYIDAGSTVSLVTGGTPDRDRYDRLLRYVEIDEGTVDVGAHMILDGYAIARYDSRDGYGAHDREAWYIDLDAQSAAHEEDCTVEQVTTTTDNPYDDGGPRNPDGSCPPGGCTPDNPNPDHNNNPYDDGGPRRSDGSCPPGGCR